MQIFILIHFFLDILASNIQAWIVFKMFKPTSKAIYKNFLTILIAGKLFEIFFDMLWKLIQLFEFQNFIQSVKKKPLLQNLLMLALIGIVAIGILNHSSLLPDFIYLKYVWNIPTYRIFMITSIFFFKNSVVQCFSQCWFFSNTSYIFDYIPQSAGWPILYQYLTIFNMSIFILFLKVLGFTKDCEFSFEVLRVLIEKNCCPLKSNVKLAKEDLIFQFQQT